MVGIFVLFVDALVYYGFLSFAPVSFAKAFAFICGTIAAYLLNKSWTFEKLDYSTSEVFRFIFLYFLALGLNVGINAFVLSVFGSLLIAYLVATATSATFNFLGQKYFVFGGNIYWLLSFRSAYAPAREHNRMKDVGNVEKARANFLDSPSNNLKFLLEHRYNWMNDYIKDGASGIEVGCGAGISKSYIKSKLFLLTDYTDNDWLDVKNVDALRTPFEKESFDFIVSSNMIHHLPYPMKFFEEMRRILKPGGVLLIQEINASFFMRLILRLTRHEGYSFSVDVFNAQTICNDPKNLWSANCAIPNLLFDDEQKFRRNVPYFKIIRNKYCEFLFFLNSGGVIAKTFYIPLPLFLLKIIKIIDNILVKMFPRILALQRQVVLKKFK